MTYEPENPEVFIRDSEAWIPGGQALCERLGAAYMYFTDGDLWAGIPGRGELLVRDLLGESSEPDRPKLASVKTIK